MLINKSGITFVIVLISSFILSDNVLAQCASAPVMEAVRNGDFEAGYLTKSGAGHTFVAGGPFDFQSDLTSGINYVPNTCTYSIGNQYGVGRAETIPMCGGVDQPHLGTGYINVPFTDHTPGQNGDGYALIADFEGYAGGRYDAGGLPCAWRQDVTIVANETYYFSAWFANYNRDAGTGGYTNPTLRFVVIPLNPATGAIVGPRTVVGSATPTGQMNWQQFNGSWASTTNTRVMLLIEVEQANLTNANDLVIDDISFINSCVNLSSLPATYIPNLGPDQSICLTNGTITLNSNSSTAGGTQYWWYENSPTPTTLVNGATNSATQNITHAGTYTVCVKNGAFTPAGCTASSTIVITNAMPSVTLADANICATANATLTASLTGTGLTYSWPTRPPGAPNPGNSQTLTHNVAGGPYQVTVTPSASGCSPVTSNNAFIRSFVSAPSVVTITGACPGNRTFDLTATGGYGAGYAWWDAASGGTQLADGSSPSLTYTSAQLPRTVYVENYATTSAHINRTAATSSSGGTPTETNFTALQNFTLVSVWVNAMSGTGCSGNFTLSLDQNGVATGLTKTVPCNVGTWQQVFLNWPITAGNTYRINASGAWFMMDDAYPQTTYSGMVTINPTTTWGYSGAAVQWTIKTQACTRTPVTLSCPLAVHFISVEAKQVTNSVHVNWSASEDSDRSPYVVQRSSNGVTGFTSIGRIAPVGAMGYTFIDYNPEDGINYYRLVKGEEEGTMEYSNAVSVNFKQHQLLKIHPNPFGNSTLVTALHHDLSSGEAMEVMVTDLSGKLLRTVSIVPGEQKEIGIDLASGTYLIHTPDGEVYKLIKIQ